MKVEAKHKRFLDEHARAARKNLKESQSQRTKEAVAPALVLLACAVVVVGCSLRWPEPGLNRNGALGMGALSAVYAIGGTLRYKQNSRKIAALQTRVNMLNALITNETAEGTIRSKLPDPDCYLDRGRKPAK